MPEKILNPDEEKQVLEEKIKKIDGQIAFLSELKTKYTLKLDKLRNAPKGTRKVALATGSYFGEGFDEPELNALFLTMPMSFKGRIIQYTGRLSRNYKDKQGVYIYDYLDGNVPILIAMHKKRIKTYKLLDYELKYE